MAMSQRQKPSHVLEQLEKRRLMAAQLNFSNFSTTTGLTLNGYGASGTTSNNQLVLTDGVANESRSILSTTEVPISTFTTHFSYVSDSSASAADGFTFVIDGGSTSDLGANGFDLGFAGGTFGANTVAGAFNIYNAGSFGSTFAFHTGGTGFTAPGYGTGVNTSPLDLHSGDTINVTMTYDGTNLAMTATDATTSQSYTASEAIDLPTIIGGNVAHVGFTAATGVDFSTQSIKSWDYTGISNGPTITSLSAHASGVVNGTKGDLDSTASANGETGPLTYAWSTIHTPSGAPTPTFSKNGSSLSNDTTAHFFKDGTYKVRLTVTDENGKTAIQDIDMVVTQVATGVRITPHKATLTTGQTQQYSGAVTDQFGHALRTAPTPTWAVTSGSGTIDSEGLFTAGTDGHLVISYTADGLTGIVGGTVVS